jgi:hypothetical protein
MCVSCVRGLEYLGFYAQNRVREAGLEPVARGKCIRPKTPKAQVVSVNRLCSGLVLFVLVWSKCVYAHIGFMTEEEGLVNSTEIRLSWGNGWRGNEREARGTEAIC